MRKHFWKQAVTRNDEENTALSVQKGQNDRGKRDDGRPTDKYRRGSGIELAENQGERFGAVGILREGHGAYGRGRHPYIDQSANE